MNANISKRAKAPSKKEQIVSLYKSGVADLEDIALMIGSRASQEAAEQSVELLNHNYRQFELARDRAGQRHTLLMALTMFNRARWTSKFRETDVFRRWIILRLNEFETVGPQLSTLPA